MKKSVLLRALQQEIRRHDFNYFVDQPPSIAQGGRGVVVPGCPACMKRINTTSQFLDHLVFIGTLWIEFFRETRNSLLYKFSPLLTAGILKNRFDSYFVLQFGLRIAPRYYAT